MRNIININKDWTFTKKGESLKTDLPHTWNGEDGQDGGNDYYRGTCTYEKTLGRAEFPEGDEVYVRFEAVNSSAEVCFNGKKLATHHGGYSAFCVKLENILETNTLKVVADNGVNDFVYPQYADFTFYGGIYRDVTLIGVNENHFDLEYFGAPGVKVTPVVEGKNAKITAEGYVKAKCGCEVCFKICDGGKVIAETKVPAESAKAELVIENVHLWDGVDDPYLYTIEASILKDGEVCDEVSARFGCRYFSIDPDKGFFLNGRPYPLRGVSRHQDRPHIGNALLRSHHEEDIDLICEMGANTVRLAHYQHSQIFYDLCDERGLVVWAEIPYISQHMPKGTENTVSQMKELICQNYNHPSIVVWGISNEITMGGANDKSLIENHKKLNDLCHSLDKTRLTTAAVISMCSPGEEYTRIPDVIAYNHYFGWYGGNTAMNGPWFDRFHKKYPKIPVGLSEYGCEALNWHTSKPEQGDYTEEYQAYYHEELIKQIEERPYIWATHVWNMFDFAADARSEGGENGMNHKGLVTFDRKYKKDSFYAYKAWLSEEKVLHICSKRYIDRVEDMTMVTVYSNLDEVELFANGKSIGKQKKGKYPFFYFDVPVSAETKIVAKAGELTDESLIRKVEKPNESYIMKDINTVINWFEISTPTGYYSVNDTIGDILKSPKGTLFLLKTVIGVLLSLKKKKGSEEESSDKGIAGMLSGIKINSTIIDMGKNFTLKRVFMMAGKIFTKEQILEINKGLNKIKKRHKVS